MILSNVILVDTKDNQTGISEKLEAHKKGLLHRAFSIFLFNDQGQLLLQKEQMKNTILVDYGRIPAAAILPLENF